MEFYCGDCGSAFRRLRVIGRPVCGPCRRIEQCAWMKRSGQRRASSAVVNAIKRGELPPAKACRCADCGGRAACYDHRDYNRPLEVQPVCSRCNATRGPALPLAPHGSL